jgi:DNA-binding SARP family transcriptional activator
MPIQILGSVQIQSGSTVQVPSPRLARMLLGILALNANRSISRESLIDALWGAHPPKSAATNLRGYLARLRGLTAGSGLSGVSIEAHSNGYSLHAEPYALDSLWFDVLSSEARRHLDGGRPEAAADRFARALALWRGPVLDGLCIPEAVQPAAQALALKRQDALEDSIEARLALGQHRELAVELAGWVAQFPMSERLSGQLMLALYRAGRQVEALAAYRSLLKRLDDELGVTPFIEIQTLYRRILRADPDLLSPWPIPRFRGPVRPSLRAI